jgi:sterol desaturase/sphingolipid hydroxylase (fatty acid hydroxylase superfamily)
MMTEHSNSTFSDLLNHYYGLLHIFFNSNERLYWLYLLTYIIFAFGIYFTLNRNVSGFFRFLFPPQIYKHQSTKIDLYILLLQPIFLVLWVIPVSVIVSLLIAVTIQSGLDFIMVSPNLVPNHYVYIVFSILWIIVYDFGQYISHYWQHKNPVLWEFHKIHHSAEVLNPLTAYRFHPLDYCFTSVIVACFTGIIVALFSWIYGQEPMIISVLKMHVVLFLFYLIGYNFRHSHIKFVYPKWLQYILVCPSQHQIHHSVEPKHWDKNMGYVFAFWDWLFGTLYIAKKTDVYEYGLSKTPDTTYRSIWNVYVQPFKNIIKILKK